MALSGLDHLLERGLPVEGVRVYRAPSQNGLGLFLGLLLLLEGLLALECACDLGRFLAFSEDACGYLLVGRWL